LARALSRIFRAAYADSRQLIEVGYKPDLGRMREQIAAVALQALGVELVAGYLRTLRRTGRDLPRRGGSGRAAARRVLHRGYGLSEKALGNPPPAEPVVIGSGRTTLIDWNLFRPEVRVAAENAALRLAGTIVEDTRRMIRDELATGLQAGEPVAAIAERIRLQGFSPRRANVIAQTESSRAMHAGEGVAARELGVTQWTWLASADACELCLSIDGKTVSIGENFYTHTTGNAAYRNVTHPPAHPNCMCSTLEVLPE